MIRNFLLSLFAIGFFFCLNGCLVSKSPKEIVFSDSVDLNKKFGMPINQFDLIVPASYSHNFQLKLFLAKYDTAFIISPYYNIDSCFKNASNNLVANQKYSVSFYPILQTVTSEECIAFLNSQNSVFVNVQGLTLAWELGSKKFPTDKWILSFDEAKNLLKDPNLKYDYHYIPIMGFKHIDDMNLEKGLWQLGYYSFVTHWKSYFAYLISFKLKPETTINIE
jgi:hypothetical protein